MEGQTVFRFRVGRGRRAIEVTIAFAPLASEAATRREAWRRLQDIKRVYGLRGWPVMEHVLA